MPTWNVVLGGANGLECRIVTDEDLRRSGFPAFLLRANPRVGERGLQRSLRYLRACKGMMNGSSGRRCPGKAG